MNNTQWTLEDAVTLCRVVESICPEFGCHVALTGGTLYKSGARKDCDLVFYRIRQAKEIDTTRLFDALNTVGLYKKSGFGWCYKAEYRGRVVDLLFPDEPKGTPTAQQDSPGSGATE